MLLSAEAGGAGVRELECPSRAEGIWLLVVCLSYGWEWKPLNQSHSLR